MLFPQGSTSHGHERELTFTVPKNLTSIGITTGNAHPSRLARYSWVIPALAPQSDHAHVVITTMRVGDQLREALKAVASRALNKQSGSVNGWSDGGSA